MTAAAPDPDDPTDGPSRGNGLTAARFVPLLDVEPRASEALLAALADVGIAACVRPRPAEGGGLDRLLVDEEGVEAARLVAERELRAQASAGADDAPRSAPVDPPVRSATRDASAEDVDAAWQAIVAGFDTTTSDPVPRWPVSEDVDTTTEDAPRSDDAAPSDRPPRRRRADRRGSDDAPTGVDDGGHYRPPPAPPVGRPSRQTGYALAAVALGVLLMVAPAVVGLGASQAVFAVGVLLLVGGVGALVLRMHDGPRTDDGPDDGAVV